MEYYVILTQSIDIEDGCYTSAMRELELDVLIYQRGNWRPQGGMACGQANGRFIVAQAMVREGEAEPDA